VISSTTILQTRASPVMRGRLLALQAIVFLGTTPIGGPIVGTVSERLGARYGLLLGAAGCVGAAFYGFAAVRRARPVTLDHDEAVAGEQAGLELTTDRPA
jgi:hypothetical protein